MKSRPRARPLPRDAGRTRPPPSKRETGRHPGLFDGKQTGPFRPSQRNSGTPSAFEKGNGPASGIFNGTHARNRPSKREPGRATAFSTGSKPFPMEFESALGLPKGKRARIRPFQRNANPQPPFSKETGHATAFSTERKPTTALRKGSRAAPRPFQRNANLSQRNSNPPSAFPMGSGPASGLFNGTQAHNRPSQRKQAAPRPS